MALTMKQQRFVDEYIKLGNAYQAARNAGYSHNSSIDSSKWINRDLLKSPVATERKKFNPALRAAIDERMAEKNSELIASQDEILEYLTSVMRGQSVSDTIVIEGTGLGTSKARAMAKTPEEKERLKAAELLGKRYGLYTEKVDMEGAVPVVISGDDALED